MKTNTKATDPYTYTDTTSVLYFGFIGKEKDGSNSRNNGRL